LLGVGAAASPRFAPAGLLVIHSRHRVVFDGGPRVQPPEGADVTLGAGLSEAVRSALPELTDRVAASVRQAYARNH
jgi:hypothetical protein